MTLGMDVCLGPVHIVLDGDTAPLPKKGQSSPIFGPSLLWPNGCMDQDATWYGGRPRPTQHCVLGLRNVVFDGDRATPKTEGIPTTTRFVVHVYCGQTAGWIKMPLGTAVGLGLRNIVFDVDLSLIHISEPTRPY